MITWPFGKRTVKSALKAVKKDDFVSLSSHELRTPLSIVKWYTEILLDEDAGPITQEQRKYLTQIQSSNQRAIDLIRALLNVSRLTLDTFSVSPALLSLTEITQEVITSLQKEAAIKKIEILEEYESALPDISLDKKLAMIMIRGLIANAISYSNKETKIQVSLRLIEEGSHLKIPYLNEASIILSVHDSGIGIKAKEQEKVFSKMFRGSNVKEDDSKGSGLSLFITKTILEHVGGEVWFTSEEDKGSMFSIAFPLGGMKKKKGETTLD